MMTYLAPLLLLLSLMCLTSPDGFGIWLQKDQVVSILHPADGECTPGAKAKVTLGNGTSVCVQEDRKAIVKKMGEDK